MILNGKVTPIGSHQWMTVDQKPHEMLHLEFRENTHTPTNKLHGQVEAMQITEIRVVPMREDGVNIDLWIEEIIKTKNSFRTTSRSEVLPEVVVRQIYEALKEYYDGK